MENVSIIGASCKSCSFEKYQGFDAMAINQESMHLYVAFTCERCGVQQLLMVNLKDITSPVEELPKSYTIVRQQPAVQVDVEYLVCLKHTRVFAQGEWVSVNQATVDALRDNDEVHVEECVCDRCGKEVSA